MADTTRIEWTDATWNPTVGCSYASAGCKNCYAAEMTDSLSQKPATAAKYGGLTNLAAGGVPVWNNTVRLVASALSTPFRDKRPKKYFVNSMSDLFHEDMSDMDIAEVWGVMASAPWHTFQVLTKRSERMRKWINDPRTPDAVEAAMLGTDLFTQLPAWPLKNVWLGVTVENQRWANARIPDLLECPAQIRFLSAEPLLGQIRLADSLSEARGGLAGNLREAGLDWVIIGGETGCRARPMHPDWARQLHDDCQAHGIAVFFKQVGDWAWTDSATCSVETEGLMLDGRRVQFGMPNSQGIAKTGAKAAGQRLDGRLIQEFP